jgi:hypothetical protein
MGRPKIAKRRFTITIDEDLVREVDAMAMGTTRAGTLAFLVWRGVIEVKETRRLFAAEERAVAVRTEPLLAHIQLARKKRQEQAHTNHGLAAEKPGTARSRTFANACRAIAEQKASQ